MKFTFSHLKRFLTTEASIDQISNALVMLGHEVECITDRTSDLSEFVIAQVEKVVPHPNANKLNICQVNDGTKTLQVVCGASNVRSGMKVVLAKEGTTIPSNKLKIKPVEIREVPSCGMLCSSDELLIEFGDSSGIIELPENSLLGSPFIELLGYNDPVIDLSITPNRGDCLGVYGIARELAAKGLGSLNLIQEMDKTADFSHKTGNSLSLSVSDEKLCPLFLMTKVESVKNQTSPLWLQNILRNSGLRPISTIVDVTNYICLSYGYPLHAYDLNKITGGCITICTLENNLSFMGLDGKKYDLKSGDLVVKNEEKIIGLAGIIGSMDSGCDSNTVNVVLETAVLDSTIIAKTGRRLKIETESRYRFERNVDPNMAIKVHQLACWMIKSLTETAKITDSVYTGRQTTESRSLDFDLNVFRKKTGISSLTKAEIEKILLNLGFSVISNDADTLNLLIPSWRSDISYPEDVIEEILRIYGYENIPEIPLPVAQDNSRMLSQLQRKSINIKRVIASRGYQEVVTWSFMNKDLVPRFDEVHQELEIINPISMELNYMRPTIIPNLLTNIHKNQVRSVKNLGFFEVGPVFLYNGVEKISLAAVRCGNFNLTHPHEKVREYDVFDLKLDLEVILRELGISSASYKIVGTDRSYYHPARSGKIVLGKVNLGYFGEIHPQILSKLSIESRVVAMEIFLSDLPTGRLKYGLREATQFSVYQPVERDFAFVVPNNVNAQDMVLCLRNIDKKLIKSVEVFDVYSGDKIGDNFKSIAFKLSIQSDNATLTEKETTVLSDRIISTMDSKFNAKIRDR